ncbi:MAG: hypothetical protein EP314_07050 [Bacteroidetes bacterium]|nr:MAG: hypothetical protein EP314_07050 [Bacteroidota bacterium]
MYLCVSGGKDMKSILNKGVHEILRLKHTPVACSAEERHSYMSRAEEIATDIRKWLGNTSRGKIGLGQNCNASWYLKVTGNKAASYPFDWIFTTPEIILDMLGDDFEALLNREMLIPHGLDAGHERYHETLFGHRNPASSIADHEYFVRCVTRWNELMHEQRPVLFVSVILYESDKRKRWKAGFTKDFQMPREQTLKDFTEVMRTISSLNPNCKFLFIEQYTTQPFGLEVIEKNEHAYWLRFDSIDENTGVQYLHEVDDTAMKTLLMQFP